MISAMTKTLTNENIKRIVKNMRSVFFFIKAALKKSKKRGIIKLSLFFSGEKLLSFLR